jgi:hypothetical protein
VECARAWHAYLTSRILPLDNLLEHHPVRAQSRGIPAIDLLEMKGRPFGEKHRGGQVAAAGGVFVDLQGAFDE